METSRRVTRVVVLSLGAAVLSTSLAFLAGCGNKDSGTAPGVTYYSGKMLTRAERQKMHPGGAAVGGGKGGAGGGAAAGG